MRKRLLITGANGMLGGTLVRIYQRKFRVFGTSNRIEGFDFVENYKSFDLSSQSYEELIEWSDPDVIIHCAALTNGNYCQQNPVEAFEINGFSLKKFTDAIKRGTKIIYISTDAVFSSQIHMASEKDCVGPENVYGKSKELGEFFLINSDVDYTIIRTTIVGYNFNPLKVSFVEWILDSARNNEEINLFDDVLFNPITIWDLSEQLENILISGSKYSGRILHIAGKVPCTKYQFGTQLLKKFNLPVEQVKIGSLKEMKGRVRRSLNQSLDCSYYETLAMTDLPDLEKTIIKLKENYSNYEKHFTRK